MHTSHPIVALLLQEEAGSDLCRIFGGHGFDTKVIEAKTIVGEVGLKSRDVVTRSSQAKASSILFAARQVRFSDEQASREFTNTSFYLQQPVFISACTSAAKSGCRVLS